jgi:hypothetical protein
MPEVELRGKRGIGNVAIVDEDDYSELSKFKWFVMSNGYAARSCWLKEEGRSESVLMHRQIMDVQPGLMVDHINMNILDNRKENLRIATRSENMVNSKKRISGKNPYKGVHWSKQHSKWKVEITKDYKNNFIGLFEDPETAARAYDATAVKFFGDFALLNFPDDPLVEFNKPATRSDNTSGYRGVSWYKSRNSWIAQINKNKEKYFLGYFECKHDAAVAYNTKAAELYGESAKLNTIKENVSV